MAGECLAHISRLDNNDIWHHGFSALFRRARNSPISGREIDAMVSTRKVTTMAAYEHPATRSACDHWSGLTGRRHVIVPHNNETGSVSAADYLPHVSRDMYLATILHTSPVTGMSVDVAEIAKVIRSASPDCIIIVDGIQHAAHGRLDVESYGIDGYVISPYKVFSRHGYGLARVSDRLAAKPHDCLLNAPGDPWELGTRDTGAYATFSDVVEYFAWLGGQFTDSGDKREQILAAGKAIQAHEKLLT